MIEELDQAAGEQFTGYVAGLGETVRYEALDDSLWRLLSPRVCSFLNGTGGQIVAGVTAGDRIVGVALQQRQIDTVGLRFDSHMNGFSPQVDARLVSLVFWRLRGGGAYVVHLAVRPGTARLYYTSFMARAAFTASQAGPRLMTREEVRLRTTNPRRFCTLLEHLATADGIFVDNHHTIRAFLAAAVAPACVNIVYLVGNAGTGKVSLVRQCTQGLLQDHPGRHLVEVHFDRILNIEDVYIAILRQMDHAVTRIASKDLELMAYEHKTIKDQQYSITDFTKEQQEQQTLNDDADTSKLEDVFFPRHLMRYSIGQHYYRLYNLFNNAVRRYHEEDIGLIICFYNANKYIPEFIPVYPCTIFITGNEQYYLQQSFKTRICTVFSKQLTVEQVQQYFRIRDALEIEQHVAQQLISYTSGSFEKIKKVVEEHKNDLEGFLNQFTKWSIRRQKAYFNDGIYEVGEGLIRYIACLSLFPELFSYDMMESMLLKCCGNNQQEVRIAIKRLGNYIHNQQGQYFITPGMRSYCLSMVDSDFGAETVKMMIDTVLEEIDRINENYEAVLRMRQSASQVDSHYIIQMCTMTINQWLRDYSSSLEEISGLCLRLDYKTSELHQKLSIFLHLKLNRDQMRQLRHYVTANQATVSDQQPLAE